MQPGREDRECVMRSDVNAINVARSVLAYFSALSKVGMPLGVKRLGGLAHSCQGKWKPSPERFFRPWSID